MRIIHVSDIHFWQYEINPLRLLGKRAIGMTELLMGRAGRFRLERISEVVERVNSLGADHILITGDVTTTALPAEFRMARAALAQWLTDPARVTIIPGNHDRYTLYAHRSGRFERYLGAFSPGSPYPWVRHIGDDTAILGLDPTRYFITATGKFPAEHLRLAQERFAQAGPIARLLVACHYPATAPARFERQNARHPLIDRYKLVDWLRTIGPHLYCCGHLHTAWAYRPPEIPDQLSLNAGAPLLRDRIGAHSSGFLEIILEGSSVVVKHHGWSTDGWEITMLYAEPLFFVRTDGLAG